MNGDVAELFGKCMCLVIGMSLVLSVSIIGSAVLRGAEGDATVEQDKILYPDTDQNLNFPGGNGSEENPYQIENWTHLNNVRDNLSASYELVNDLDNETDGYDKYASEQADDGKGWNPIGNNSERFKGSLYGNESEIRNLYISRDSWYVGLFGYIGIEGEVSRIGVVEMNLTESTGNRYFVGGIAGSNGGSIYSSYSSGNIKGINWVAGLVGKNENGDINSTYVTGEVSADGQNGGALVGENTGTVANSFWNNETSGQDESAGGTGKNTTEMQEYETYANTSTEGLDEPWDILRVEAEKVNTSSIWNIVDGWDYPFLSWKDNPVASEIDFELLDWEVNPESVEAGGE
ncbi:MAG: hypothetical protein V5A88_10240, partial [Candidatus Thermoplasmatota archaeon]